MSEATGSVLKEAFSRPVANTTRRRWRRTHDMPTCDDTKCPKLDNTVKAQVPNDCKDANRSLSRFQTLVLDAVGPLTSLLEVQQDGHLTTEAAAEAATPALHFLGNAHSHISAERRKRAVTYLNKDLRPLVEEDEHFTAAAPYLFGKDFEKSAKHHIDSMKSLRKISQTQANNPKVFSVQPPPQSS